MANVSKFPMRYNTFPVENLKRLAEELNQHDIESISVVIKRKDDEWPDLYAYGETATNNAELIGVLEFAKHLLIHCITQVDDPDED